MRVKLGHVTNSSSVSFVGYGVCLENVDSYLRKLPDDVLKVAYESYVTSNKKYNIDTIPFEEFKEHPSEYAYDLMEEVASLNGLTIQTSDWGTYIGATLSFMSDTETKSQMVNRVTTTLASMGIDKFPGWIDEAWRDG